MKRKNTTRNALFTSIISLLLCVSMLVGTTFAWFTDTVTSGVNTIAAGNLDVELYHSKANDFTDPDKVNSKTLLFTDVNGNEIENWEPGVVAFTNLQVANVGTLALKYQLSVNSTEVNYVEHEGELYSLADALKVAVVKEGVSGTREQVIAAADEKGWTALESFTLSGELEGDEKSDTYGIVIYWEPSDNDDIFNLNNGKTTVDGDKVLSITLGVNLYATQEMYENDSFGEDYDDNAWHPDMLVYTADDLNDALANGLNAKLMNDIEIDATESNINVPEAVATTYSLRNPVAVATVIDLNGYTITGTVGRDENGRVHTLVNNGNLILTNGTIKSAGENGGSAIYNAAGATLTLENVTVLGAPYVKDGNWPSYGINNYGTMTINGATVKTYHGGIATGGEGVTVINDADVDVGQGVANGITSWALYTCDNGELTVNGGTYANTKTDTAVNGGGYLCEGGSKPIVITGGNFYGGCGMLTGDGREYIISGGQFDRRVDKATLADGYQCKAINGEYHVVTTDTMLAYEATGLKRHLESTETKKVMLVGNIDLDNIAITVPSGANIELNLNGYTISGSEMSEKSFGLITINPGAELTINDTVGTGAITLSAALDRDWNAYSSVISNQRGKLTVNGGTIEHFGGTDMAYGIDNLTNGKNTYAETVINGGVIKSTYRAIRQFQNGIESENILTVNGGTIEGANKSIWMHDPSVKANNGTLTVSADATLIGDIYLFVTAGSTEWPVNVAIAQAVVDDDTQILTGNVPTGYAVELKDGVYGVYKNIAVEEEKATIDGEAAAEILDDLTGGVSLDVDEKVDIIAFDTNSVDAQGATVVMNGTGPDAYGYLAFMPDAGEDVTLSNLNVTGSGFVCVGYYGQGGGTYELNNVNITDFASTLKNGDKGFNLACAFMHYGNATLNNCVMTGTTAIQEGAMPVDLASANGFTTVVNGGEYGTIYSWSHAYTTINGAKVDTMYVAPIKGTVTIKAGSHVGTINIDYGVHAEKYADGSKLSQLVIEDGATIDAIVFNGTTYTLTEWNAR